MANYRLEQIRRRKQLRKQWLKNTPEYGSDIILGACDLALDRAFPSCKMFINIEIKHKDLVISSTTTLGRQAKEAIIKSNDVPKYFSLDAVIKSS